MENTPRTAPAPRGKRLFAALLAALMAFGLFPLSALADTDPLVGVDNYVATLVADPDTSTAIPVDFGTEDADGRVWVDKSVKVADSGSSFDVTLSALAQEYIRTVTGTKPVQSAADVALVLDMSASMTDARIAKMTDAVNRAIELIMDANSNNRVGVYYFHTSANTLMPLASYRIPGVTGDGESTVNRYITNNAQTITVNSGIKVNGTATEAATTSTGVDNGTATQYGLYAAISALKTDIASRNKTTFGGERCPYVLLFTDGEANRARVNWFADVTSAASGGTERQGSGMNGTPEITALTILTAAKLKDELSTAYNIYNGNGETSNSVVWFNVALGVPTTPNTRVTALMEPANLIGTIAAGNGIWQSVRDNIHNYTTGTPNGGFPQYGDDPEDTPGFVFADEYIYYVQDPDIDGKLTAAFDDLAKLVVIQSSANVIPVVTNIGTSGEAATGVVFTDVLGDHMELNASKLKLAGTSAKRDAAKSTDTVDYYTFDLKSSTVTYDRTTRTLTWNLSAEDMADALVRFINSGNPVPGEYKPLPDPIRLTYNVTMAKGYDEGDALYSNDDASVVFTPTMDNPYYYDITYYAQPEGEHSAGDYKEGTPKTIASIPTLGQLAQSIAKSPNLTDTSPFSQSCAWGADDKFITTLGNNGKLTPMLNITKSADPDSALTGIGTIDVTYTIVVQNFTGETISDVVVGDTLPAGMTLVADSLKVGGTSVAFDSSDASSFTYTIASLHPGNTVITYQAELDTEESGTYTNKATIKSVTLDPQNGSQTVTPEAKTEISVVVGDPIPAKVVVTLDASAYGGRTVTLHRKGSPLEYTLSEGTSGTYDGAEVLEGEYDVYVGGVPTGITLTVVSGGENEAQVEFYTVTFYDGGIKYDDPAQQIVLSGGKAVKPGNPTKAGYTFVKWVDKDGNEFDFTNTAITVPTDIYASWTQAASNVDIPDITVTFDSQGGTPVSPITTAPRTRIDPPVPPTRPGYIFTGWYKDPACTTPWDFTQRVNYSITLYAGWIASPVVVVPKTGGSSAWLGFAMAASALLLAGAVQLGKRKKER